MNLRRISHAIDRGALFLARNQLNSGEIPVTLSFDRELRDARHDPCVFGSALTALTLRRADSPLIRLVVARAIRHIAEQRRCDGTWAYWPHWFNVASDADDTACCSMALCQANSADSVTIRRNRRFFKAHRDSAGLFQTWFQPGWNITDSVVNANVLCYLGDDPGTYAVVDYLVNLIERDQEAGSYPYYSDSVTLYYSIARAMQRIPRLRRCRATLTEKLRMRLSETRRSPQIFRAQCLSALALLGTQLMAACQPAVNDLLEAQDNDGGLPAEAFYTGPPGIPLTNWYGSREMSTVLCLEALLRASHCAWGITAIDV